MTPLVASSAEGLQRRALSVHRAASQGCCHLHTAHAVAAGYQDGIVQGSGRAVQNHAGRTMRSAGAPAQRAATLVPSSATVAVNEA